MSYFLFVPLRFFFLCYPGEALEGPISTGVSNKLKNIDSNNGILISKNTILNKQNQLWTSIEEKKNIYILNAYVPDEGSLLPKYRDCTTSNDFELYLMCCGVMLLLLIVYICVYMYIYVRVYIYIYMSNSYVYM